MGIRLEKNNSARKDAVVGGKLFVNSGISFNTQEINISADHGASGVGAGHSGFRLVLLPNA